MLAFPQLRSRTEIAEWRAWLPGVAEIVLVALLALQVARLAWLALTPVGPIGRPAAATASMAAPPPSLPTVDVFFRSAAVASSGSGEALGYRLFGVRSEPGDGGSAILGKDGEQASYAVGREVAPGVVLASVGAAHAVLVANGASHRLDLPRLAATDGTGSVPAALPVGAPPEPAAAKPYTLPQGAQTALLRPAGLRPGDVVLSVNGRPFDPARLAGLRDELKGKSQLTIQYRRDGKTHTTTLQAPR